MTRLPEDEVPEGRWITPLISVPAAMMCIGIGWASLLFLHFPSIRAIGGLALAGFSGYGIFNGLQRLSRRSRPAAVVAGLCVTGAIVFVWPTACVTAGGKFGTPIKHYCRCEGLTVTTGPDGYDVPITTYCFGWEIEDVWEEKIAIDIN